MQKKTVPGRNTTAEVLQNELEINAKAASIIHNAATNIGHQQAIIESYTSKDPSKGFAAKAIRFPLERLKRDYVLHQSCQTCQSNGKVSCTSCQTTGKTACERCQAQGMVSCQQCNGQRFTYNNGKKQQCHSCHGQGKTQCQQCHGHRHTACAKCKANGYIICAQCAGSGIFSLMHHIDIEALTDFKCDYIKEIPEDIANYLYNEKSRRAFMQEANVTPIVNNADDFTSHSGSDAMSVGSDHTDGTHKHQQDTIAIPFEVKCPYGDIIIDLNGKEVAGKILGYRPLFLHYEPFVEELAKQGIENLTSAAKDRASALPHLKRACKFSLIKECLSLTIKNNNTNALKQMMRIYPIGVTTPRLKQLIVNTRRSLKNITFVPRLFGITLGMIISAALYFFYMNAGGHKLLPQQLWNNDPLISQGFSSLLQLTPLILIYLFGTSLSKIKIRLALNGLVDPGELDKLKANIGNMYWIAFGGYMISAFFICELYAPADALPLWFSLIRQYIPL